MDIEKLKSTFREHVLKYDMTDVNIIRKLYHSYRVMELCLLLAKNNNFNKEATEISVLIGLLHDYSRFEQWSRFQTYSDINSIDHGNLAVKRLFKDGEITNYCINKKYYDEIYDAIKYHNKYMYPNNLSDHNKIFCKVIRDADKLDIFYLLGISNDLLKEDEHDISAKIKEDFFNNKLLNRVDAKNQSDNILLSLAMVFDLNFEYSFKYLHDRKLIDKIFENIKDKEKFKIYFDYINDYIKNKIN